MTTNKLTPSQIEEMRKYAFSIAAKDRNTDPYDLDPELQELSRMIDEHNDMFIEELERSELD